MASLAEGQAFAGGHAPMVDLRQDKTSAGSLRVPITPDARRPQPPRSDGLPSTPRNPVNALAEAGARAETVVGRPVNAVFDRERITGQQPMSAPESGDVLLKMLNAAKR